MYTVADLLPDAYRILGSCDRAYVLRRLNSAVELLANKGDFDPYIAVLDIVACGRLVALPPEVETPLSINMGGYPMFGRDRLFSFHLNGPGDQDVRSCVRWSWQDSGEAPVFSQPVVPGRLFATADDPADTSLKLRVYGTDKYGNKVGRVVDSVFVEGLDIDIGTTVVTPAESLPQMAKIDRVSKAKSRGIIRLWYHDDVSGTNTLVANYEPAWMEPMFRLILLERTAPWVRILFRKRNRQLSDDCDLIPLHSLEAVTAMLHALKYYDDGNIEAAQSYEATALRWLSDEQRTRRAPLWLPPQVDDAQTILPLYDQIR